MIFKTGKPSFYVWLRDPEMENIDEGKPLIMVRTLVFHRMFAQCEADKETQSNDKQG